MRTGKLAPRPRQLEEVEQQQEQEQGGEQHLRGAARQLAWSAPVTNGANSLLVVRVVQKFPTVAGQADRSPGFCDETCVRVRGVQLCARRVEARCCRCRGVAHRLSHACPS